MGFVDGKPQAHERFSEAALLALLTLKQQHPRATCCMVDGALPGG